MVIQRQRKFLIYLPILQQFILSAEGKPDLEWWNQICCHFSGGSGPHYSSGWISVFAVFGEEGQWYGDTCQITRNQKEIKSSWPIIDFSWVPEGIAEFPISIDENGQRWNAILNVGFLGVQQLAIPRVSMQPVLGWELIGHAVAKD